LLDQLGQSPHSEHRRVARPLHGKWCIIGEGNNKQRHAFATGVGGDRSTWHHNLFSHMQSRVPRWGGITVQCDFRNNVIYDWGHGAGYGDLRTLNYVNNYLRPGPSTT
jgi:hypothetical protein